MGSFGVNTRWWITNDFLWKCRKQLKTLTSSNEGLKTNYVSRRVQTHLRFLKSDWSIKSYWKRKAIYQSFHPFIIMYIRKWRLNRVNPLGYYYTYSKNKKYKATTFFVIIFRHLNIKIFFLKGKCKKKIPFVSLSTKGGKWFASCSTHLKPKKCELQMKCITCKKNLYVVLCLCFYFIFFFYTF